MFPIVFPLEIEEMILDILSEDDEGHSTLKTCSLVCQAFLPMCRKHIFGSIVLNATHYASDLDGDMVSTPSSHTTHAFERLLRETPEIADYIRKLDYTIRTDDLTSPSIQESLKRISRLEFLSVDHNNWMIGTTLDWSNNPIRSALLHLLHLPTLTHFKMARIDDFVISDLIPCVNLKYLDIVILTTGAAETTFPAALPEHSVQLNEFIAGTRNPTAIKALCTARRPDGRPIIDFGSLSKITVAIQMPDEDEASQELFRHCHALTSVNISFWNPRNVRPSLVDMLRPSMQTLKHILVDFDVDDDDVDPLFGFPSELEEMRTKNVIETVTIKILVETDANCRRGDDWGRLDQVLTSPGWFSLERVSLAIEIGRFLRIDNELEVALRIMAETQFPRLSSSDSILFDFDVNSDSDGLSTQVGTNSEQG